MSGLVIVISQLAALTSDHQLEVALQTVTSRFHSRLSFSISITTTFILPSLVNDNHFENVFCHKSAAVN